LREPEIPNDAVVAPNEDEDISTSPYLDERKTNLMHLLYIFIVAARDALHVSGVFAHRQER
jgi:hypothetical protein